MNEINASPATGLPKHPLQGGPPIANSIRGKITLTSPLSTRGDSTFLLVEFASPCAIDLTMFLMFKSEMPHCREQLTNCIKVTSRKFPSTRASLLENMNLTVYLTFSVLYKLKQQQKSISQFEGSRGEKCQLKWLSQRKTSSKC